MKYPKVGNKKINVSRTEFLQLPRHRKLVILKSHIENKNGISQSELEKQCTNFTKFLEKSLARDLKISVKQLKQRLIDFHENNFNRQVFEYKPYPISGRK